MEIDPHREATLGREKNESIERAEHAHLDVLQFLKKALLSFCLESWIACCDIVEDIQERYEKRYLERTGSEFVFVEAFRTRCIVCTIG